MFISHKIVPKSNSIFQKHERIPGTDKKMKNELDIFIYTVRPHIDILITYMVSMYMRIWSSTQRGWMEHYNTPTTTKKEPKLFKDNSQFHAIAIYTKMMGRSTDILQHFLVDSFNHDGYII